MSSPAPPVPDFTSLVGRFLDYIEDAKRLVRNGIPVSEHAEFAATVIDSTFAKILADFSKGDCSSKSNTDLLGLPATLSPVKRVPMFLPGPKMHTAHTSQLQPMTSTPRPDRPRFVPKAFYRTQFPKFQENIEVITIDDSDEENDSVPTDGQQPQPHKQEKRSYPAGNQPIGNTPVSQFYPEQPLHLVPRSFVQGRSVFLALQQLSNGGPPMVKVAKHGESTGPSLLKRSIGPVKMAQTGFMPNRRVAFPAVIKKAQVGVAKENLNPRAGNVPTPTKIVSKDGPEDAACATSSVGTNTRRPKMVRCPEHNCGKYIRSSYFGQHQRAHQEFKPYRCTWKKGSSVCPFKTKYRSNIREHIRKVHLKDQNTNLINSHFVVDTNVPEQPEEN